TTQHEQDKPFDSKDRTFLITTRIQNLSVRYNPITNSANLLSHLRVLETVVDEYINGLDNVMLRQIGGQAFLR
ncbi:hypothetical protein ACLBQC_32585, partial [Klebsiella pneumoniae]|uniref:hypothetical protein n=1 Tax=Klebsiella pneumoniae TaxID=573 RepID=UPI003969870E